MNSDASLRHRDLAVLLVALALPTAITWVYFYRAESLPPKAQLAIFNGVKILQFAIPVVWVAAVQRGRVRLRPEHGRGVAFGLAFGAVVAAAALGLFYGYLRHAPAFAGASAEIQAKLAGWKIDSLAKYAALGVFYSLVHSLLEEYYWRWFVFGQLRRRTTLWPAVAISAMGFMAHHVLVVGKFFGVASPWTWFFSLSVAVGGAVWAWLYERTGSLVGPWLSHLLVDAAIFAAGYELVRGGIGG